jgi:hypothetical protein
MEYHIFINENNKCESLTKAEAYKKYCANEKLSFNAFLSRIKEKEKKDELLVVSELVASKANYIPQFIKNMSEKEIELNQKIAKTGWSCVVLH